MPNNKRTAAVGKGNGCPYYKKCGGCHLQNMTYEEQLKYKQIKCIKLLGKFCRVKEVIGMEEPTHYRCKVQAAFSKDKTGIISGVYQSSTHKIVPIDSCLIEDSKADEIIVTIRKLLKSFKLLFSIVFKKVPYSVSSLKLVLSHFLSNENSLE